VQIVGILFGFTDSDNPVGGRTFGLLTDLAHWLYSVSQ